LSLADVGHAAVLSARFEFGGEGAGGNRVNVRHVVPNKIAHATKYANLCVRTSSVIDDSPEFSSSATIDRGVIAAANLLARFVGTVTAKLGVFALASFTEKKNRTPLQSNNLSVLFETLLNPRINVTFNITVSSDNRLKPSRYPFAGAHWVRKRPVYFINRFRRSLVICFLATILKGTREGGSNYANA